MDVEAILDTVMGKLPQGTPKEVDAACAFRERLWDLRLLQAYVRLLARVNQTQAMDLDLNQVTWSWERTDRVKAVRDSRDASRVSMEKTYNDSTRGRVVELEDMVGHPDKELEGAGEQEVLSLPPERLIPKKLVFSWDGEKARTVVEKAGGGFAEIKALWDADLLLAYVKLLRTLSMDEGLALAVEEDKWAKGRFALWEEFSHSDGSEAKRKKWADGYATMTRKRIEKLRARLAKAGPEEPDWVEDGFYITDTVPSPDSRFVAYELESRRGNYVHVSDQKTGVGSDIDSPDQEDIQAYLKETSGFQGEASGRRWLEKVTWLKGNRLEVVFRLSLFRGVNGNDMLVTRLYANQDGKGFRQVGKAKFEQVRPWGGG